MSARRSVPVLRAEAADIERAAAVAYIEDKIEQFAAIAGKNGNRRMSRDDATLLRLFFEVLAQEIRTGLHVGDEAPVVKRPLGRRQIEFLETLAPSSARFVVGRVAERHFSALSHRGLVEQARNAAGEPVEGVAVITAAGVAELETSGRYPLKFVRLKGRGCA